MTLTCSLLTQTDTAPLATTLFISSLVTALSAVPVCEEMKLPWPIKTIVLLPQLLTQPAQTCSHPPNFHLGQSPNSPSISK